GTAVARSATNARPDRRPPPEQPPPPTVWRCHSRCRSRDPERASPERSEQRTRTRRGAPGTGRSAPPERHRYAEAGRSSACARRCRAWRIRGSFSWPASHYQQPLALRRLGIVADGVDGFQLQPCLANQLRQLVPPVGAHEGHAIVLEVALLAFAQIENRHAAGGQAVRETLQGSLDAGKEMLEGERRPGEVHRIAGREILQIALHEGDSGVWKPLAKVVEDERREVHRQVTAKGQSSAQEGLKQAPIAGTQLENRRVLGRREVAQRLLHKSLSGERPPPGEIGVRRRRRPAPFRPLAEGILALQETRFQALNLALQPEVHLPQLPLQAIDT